MEATPLHPPFPKLLAEFLIPIAPDRVAYGIIQATGDENIRAQDLGPLLNSDSGYRHYLFSQTFLSERMTEWSGETKEVANRDEILLGRILGLMGKTSIRNLIACAHTARVLGEKVVKEGDDKISVTPSRVIPFAIAAEKICEDRNWIFPEAAFSAGLHYDWLQAAIKRRNGPPEEKVALESAFKEGLKIAKTSYLLALKMKEIKLAKFLFSAGLLLPIGKVLMACLFPKSENERSWSKFVSDCEQSGERRADFYRCLESRRFKVGHLELGSLFVNFGGLLRVIEKAIYFSSEPERLKKIDLGLFQLASILLVVRNLELVGEKGLAEPAIESWMKTNKITPDMIKEASTAAEKGI